MGARTVLTGSDIDRTLRRIAHEIVEAVPESSQLVLLGISTRGAVLAGRLSALIESITGHAVPHGDLDVTMFRDDLQRGGYRTPAHGSSLMGNRTRRYVCWSMMCCSPVARYDATRCPHSPRAAPRSETGGARGQRSSRTAHTG